MHFRILNTVDERRVRARNGSVLAVRAMRAAMRYRLCCLLAAVVSAAGSAHGQGVSTTFAVMAAGVVTRADPAFAGRAYTEGQLTQPNAMIGLRWKALAFNGTLNGEGWTLQRGELNAGIYGEGYVDRRHPHTLVHEAMLALSTPPLSNGFLRGAMSFSLAAGKGFVPFGTDDPMMRPFEKYPVNHHHSQILERVQVIGATRIARGTRALTIEAAIFNGDEPTGPFTGPQWSRVGDSRAGRATALVARGIELSASKAFVLSPEIIQGGAFDHGMRNFNVRVDRPGSSGNTRYGMIEWSRTDEKIDGQNIFRYETALAEGALGWHGAEAALRLERTDRAEQRRLLDPFRTPLGHIDFQIIGVTRWNVATVALKSPPLAFGTGKLASRVVPFVEVARAQPEPRRRPTVFEPAGFYGASVLWSITLGLRMHIGAMPARMGRYGVQHENASSMMHHEHGTMSGVNPSESTRDNHN